MEFKSIENNTQISTIQTESIVYIMYYFTVYRKTTLQTCAKAAIKHHMIK